MLYYLPAVILILSVIVTITFIVRSKWLRKQPFFLVLMAIPGIFVCIGLVFTTVLVSLARASAAELEALPSGTDFSVFAKPENGTRISLTGRLADNPVLTDDEFDIREMGFVIFRLERFNDEDDGSMWTYVRQRNPQLVMAVDGGELELLPEDDGNVWMTGSMVRERVNNGDFRFEGFRNGSDVTVIGSKFSDTQLLVSRIHGGDMESLLDNNAGATVAFMVIGLCFGLGGSGFIVVFGLIARLVSSRATAPSLLDDVQGDVGSA